MKPLVLTPEKQAVFTNAAGKLVPDPVDYSAWFDAAPEGKRAKAIGARRYYAAKEKLADAGRAPQYADFLDPKTADLLPVATIKNEPPAQQAERRAAVDALIVDRQERIREVYTFGFERVDKPPTEASSPGPAPAKPTAFARLSYAKSSEDRAAIEKGIADDVSYGTIHKKSSETWTKAIAKAIIQFPELRRTLQFVGTAQELIERQRAADRPSLIKELMYEDHSLTFQEAGLRADRQLGTRYPAVGNKTYALSSDHKDVGGIGIHEVWARNPKELTKELRRLVSQNYYAKGTGTVKALCDHELGHQLHDLLELEHDAELVRIFNSTDLEAELSWYGSQNIFEMIAEAVAEARNARKPRALARRIYTIIKDRYKRRFGRTL